MLRFLEAGLFAAARQFAAIMVVTLIVMLLVSQDLIDSGISAAGSDPPDICRFISRFLGGTYLLTAIGLALTRDRSVTATAARIRYAARLSNGARSAAGSFLNSPRTVRSSRAPLLLIEIVKYFGVACAAPAVWTGIISIGIAFLGANAHAAIRAL